MTCIAIFNGLLAAFWYALPVVLWGAGFGVGFALAFWVGLLLFDLLSPPQP